MGGLAMLARQMGYQVTGSDSNVYPPMSDQLAAAGIDVMSGYAPEHLQPAPDLVVMGNAMSRGNAAVEYVLNKGLPYTSGPQWLAENVLPERWVLAVSGTHGKTTTSSMLAHILTFAGLSPGFLIGGVPGDFGVSARLGETPFFVIEADEYDTAFFDKRAKFVHYRPRTLLVNNLEFDHADIYADLAAIQTQFHHLIRTVPGDGLILSPVNVPAIDDMLARGCWSNRQQLGQNADWQVISYQNDGSHFKVQHGNETAEISWSLLGQHNIANALGAVAAAHHVGVTLAVAAQALSCFKGVKRRLELRGEVAGVAVYDDFAHHPTAIKTTLAGLRDNNRNGRLLAVFEPRSNTMKMGVHQETLGASFHDADQVFWYQDGEQNWSLQSVKKCLEQKLFMTDNIDNLVETVIGQAQPGDKIVIMSNGGFAGIHDRILQGLAS
ncbi:UDP-N-acetylmuramate:L-alanyl-gamma-D-glutamyl- meso-diaminopimelate ligase [Methylophaga frappieri]|uniref:UDP-N-acetylmuramate--L-alanyl-gamma-D-glutamyl-meso-2,6-diaminoheptandioate ligase n=2 Tax=Methylophaga frappieri (strain ATCC BAA-2434 / DSM 25690 / JAM7) TaxID=754477 RepID=I1YKR1_METFJ|nr:UDP-N-acetylmuramate:L-alanyl-gamma-D-glutamyl- meso-diaminopimelate ligase [Methylophaga frappieri]